MASGGMSRARSVSLHVLILFSSVLSGISGERNQSYFELDIPRKLELLPAIYEARKRTSVYKCSNRANAVIYGMHTAFQLNGAVNCKLQISVKHPFKFIRCNIPLKIQWLRAKNLDGNSGE